MSEPDIVITSLGVWSAAGTSPGELWLSATTGRSPARHIDLAGHRVAICEAPDPPPCPAFPPSHRMDRSARFALAAASAAFSAAQAQAVDPARVAVLVGNSRGPVGTADTARTRRVLPADAANTTIGSLSGALSIALHARGPCLTVSASCASAAHALALGALLLRSGDVDLVMAGGAEAPLVPTTIAQFAAAGLLGTHADPAHACRPFDRTRNGTVMGEGAAFLVLERSGDARHRGVPALARLAGAAMGAESYNRVAARPDGAGLDACMKRALTAAGVGPESVGHVHAHGTGTVLNDHAEAAALRSVFGARLAEVAITSTKGLTGHTLGASAALQAVLAVEALRRQSAPPTTGFGEPDTALGVVPVSGGARPLACTHAIANSLGFWGNAASMIFGLPA